MRKTWRSALLFLAIGVAAVALLIPMTIDIIETTLAQYGDQVQLTLTPLQTALLASINPLVLIIVATLLGHWLTPKLGLRSLTVDADRARMARAAGNAATPSMPAATPQAESGAWRTAARTGVIGGMVVGLALLIGDALFSPFVAPELSLLRQPLTLYRFAVSLLFGGIVEEIMMRWGLMSLLVWALWRLTHRRQPVPRVWAFWLGNVVAALLFGLGHYGATIAITPMTAAVFARMILLNGVGGVIFGRLFWRRSLEAAIVAHMFTHVTFFAVTGLYLTLNM